MKRRRSGDHGMQNVQGRKTEQIEARQLRGRKERRGEKRKSRGEGEGESFRTGTTKRKKRRSRGDFFLSHVFPVLSIVSLSCPSVSRSDGQGDESLCAFSHFFPLHQSRAQRFRRSWTSRSPALSRPITG